MTIVRWLLATAVPALLIVAVFRRSRRRPGRGRPRRRAGGVGTAAVGTIYDLLNEDKRRAVEIIVEGRAEERRPEYPDGNLPDLEAPDTARH